MPEQLNIMRFYLAQQLALKMIELPFIETTEGGNMGIKSRCIHAARCADAMIEELAKSDKT